VLVVCAADVGVTCCGAAGAHGVEVPFDKEAEGADTITDAPFNCMGAAVGLDCGTAHEPGAA